MNAKYHEYKLAEICTRLSSGKPISADLVKSSGKYPVIGGNGIRGFTDTYNFEGECTIIGRQGAACGNVRYYSGKAYLTEHAIALQAGSEHNTRYLSYLLSIMKLGRLSGQSAQPGLSVKVLASQLIAIPAKITQDQVASTLAALDNKISLNNRINDYLEEMLIALQRWVAKSEKLEGFRADEVFDIHIGKTPPRKEPEWFSFNHDCNVVWVSIKDMGSGDVFLIDSSEYLTPEAVEKYNVKRCEPGSILLSFKLTVGRVSIAANEMVTNEAIACFSSDDPRKLAYLYPVLKSYDYASLGSTSSIATAVNSKMIKSMDLQMPPSVALERFHERAKPLYDLLLSNAKEIASLVELRNALLPKLMSGEIDVSRVDFTQLNNHLFDC